MFNFFSFFGVFPLPRLIFPLLYQLLLVVHILVFVVFLVSNKGHKNWVVSAERFSLIFQILLQKFAPEHPIVVDLWFLLIFALLCQIYLHFFKLTIILLRFLRKLNLYVQFIGGIQIWVLYQKSWTIIFRQTILNLLRLHILLASKQQRFICHASNGRRTRFVIRFTLHISCGRLGQRFIYFGLMWR